MPLFKNHDFGNSCVILLVRKKTAVFCFSDSLVIIISASFGFYFLSFCVLRQKPRFFEAFSNTAI